MRLQHNVDAVVVMESATLFGLVGARDSLQGYRAFDRNFLFGNDRCDVGQELFVVEENAWRFLWELHSVYNSGWVQDPNSFERKMGADLRCVAICPMFGVQGRRQILTE
jgi:hypothetical protein